MVTAELGPFNREGSLIDIHISALGNAKVCKGDAAGYGTEGSGWGGLCRGAGDGGLDQFLDGRGKDRYQGGQESSDRRTGA